MKRHKHTRKICTHAVIVVGHHFGFSLKKSCADRLIRGKYVVFIETINADNKMKTSFLTRYLWHLMILYILISTESIYKSKHCAANQIHSHFDEDEITTNHTTMHTTHDNDTMLVRCICLPSAKHIIDSCIYKTHFHHIL